MSEWLKEHAWKACKVARLSQVRILSSPPEKHSQEWLFCCEASVATLIEIGVL